AVDHADQLLHLGDLLGRVADHEGVGALVGHQAAARRKEAGVDIGALTTLAATAAGAADTLGLGQRLIDLGGVVVVDLDVLGDQLDAVGKRDAGIFLVLLVLGDLRLRRDPDDVAAAALVQALGLQDDVQRLVPRHVDQPQGDVAGDGVGGDDVQPRLLGDQLQHGAHRHVLEVERDRTTRVAAAVARGGDGLA